jgi:ADP-ribosylglycohydrolase
VLSVLFADGEIDQDRLARAFADTYAADPARGYGYGMHELLPELRHRPDAWRTRAAELFDGQGSLGSGAAMRAAPLGAWFHADLARAVAQAELAMGGPPRPPGPGGG